jgi:Caspase domain
MKKILYTFLVFYCASALLAANLQAQNSTGTNSKGGGSDGFSLISSAGFSGDYHFDLGHFKSSSARLMSDGQHLLIVGTEQAKGGKPYGVLYQCTRENGFIGAPKEKYRHQDCLFNDVVQAADGMIYISGVSVQGATRKGLLIVLDPNSFDPFWEPTTAEEELGKMTWLDCGTGLVVAKNKHSYPNAIRIYRILGKDIKVKPNIQPIGAEIDMAEVTDLFPIPNTENSAWLAGTTTKGDSWLLRVSALGESYEDPKTTNYRSKERITGAAATPDGGVLMVGGVKESSEHEEMLLLAAPADFMTTTTTIKYFSSANAGESAWLLQSDYIAGVTATSVHNFLIWHCLDQRGYVKHELRYTNGNEKGKVALTLPGDYPFNGVAMLRDSDFDQYFLVGNETIEGKGKNTTTKLRIVALQEHYAKGKAKGASSSMQGAATEPDDYVHSSAHTNVDIIQCEGSRFQVSSDQSSNNLTANQSGVIRINLVNNGPAVSGAILKVTDTRLLANGIEVTTLEKPFSIGADAKKVVTIGLLAGSNVAYSTNNQVEIEIWSGGKMVGTCHTDPFTSGHLERSKETVLRVENPSQITKGAKAETTSPKTTIGIGVERAIKDIPSNSVVLEQKGKPGRAQKSNNGTVVGLPQANSYLLQFEVDLEMGENRFIARLDPSLGGDSTVEIIIIRRDDKPRVHLIAIGIPYFGNKHIKSLKYTQHDAKDFAKGIEQMISDSAFGSFGFKAVLTDSISTTEDTIRKVFEKLRNVEIDSFDYLYVFISGHGIPIDNEPFIVPSNYDGSSNYLIDYNYYIKRYLNKPNCKRFIFVDACHSGAGKGGARAWNDTDWQKSITPGMVAFFSSQGDQESFEYEAEKNGVFTQAILDAWAGIDLPMEIKESKLSIQDMEAYLAKRVSVLCQKSGNPIQNPKVKNNGLPSNLRIFNTHLKQH